MRFHSQRLSRGARAWLHIGRSRLHAELSFRPQARLGIGLESGGCGDDHVLLHVHAPVGSLYLGVACRLTAWLSRWAQRRDGAECGINCEWERDGPEIRINVASRIMSWRSGDPWWCKGVKINFADLLLGRRVHTEAVVSESDVLIPMPEGSYRATCKISDCTWRRPRSPFKTKRRGAYVDIPGGIGHSGKGENSWDCGDDGLYGLSCDATTPEEAVGRVVASVLKSRRKYGTASYLADKQPVMAEVGEREGDA